LSAPVTWHALAHYNGFQYRGFRISWVFDNDPTKIGKDMDGLLVQDVTLLEDIVRQNQAKMAILAVSAAAAQEITDQLVAAGIQAILSYAPVHLNVPEGVKVSYSDPVVQMQHMTFYLEE